MIIGYVRVSKSTSECENQKGAITRYTNAHKIFVDEFIEVEMSSRKGQEKRKITELLSRIGKGDTIIVAELSRIGRSVTDVLGIVQTIVERGARLVCIKENIDVCRESENMQSKVMLTLISLFSELERDIISARTKDALQTLRDRGVKLGRPKGIYTSMYDGMLPAIKEYLEKGIPISSIAKLLGVKYQSLYNFCAKRKLVK